MGAMMALPSDFSNIFFSVNSGGPQDVRKAVSPLEQLPEQHLRVDFLYPKTNK